MAFTRSFGNIPIIANAYNIAVGSTDLFNAGGFAVYQNCIEKSTPLETSNYVRANGKDFGILDIGVWGDGHKKLMIAPLKSNSILTQDTTLEYGCTGYHWSFGSPVVDCAYLANPSLSLNEFPWGGSAGNGERVYGLAVACYSDSLGARLSGIAVFFCTINDAAPEQYWRVDNFDPSFSYNIISVSALERLGYTVNVSSSSEDYGDESENGGYGQSGEKPDYDHHSDIISVPQDPQVSTGTVGFMNVYKVSSGALSGLGQYLFPQFDPSTLTDIVAVLRAIAGIFAYQDSIQYVVDLHAVPCSPTLGSNKYIKLGALETDISQPTCASDYVNVDCGSVSIPERFQNFLDFVGVTCKVFIPFVGFVDIAPEYWVGGTIGLKYKFNIIDGSFMAFLVSTSGKSELSNTVIGQFAGNACLHLPVVAASYGAIISGIAKGSATMASAAATENIGDVVSGALTACNFQPKMSQSNDYNGSSAYLGGRRPYLLIEYTVQSFSSKYNIENGLPLNVACDLGSVSGFTVVENPHLSLTCDADEKEEIESLLKSGVIF